MVDRYSVNVFTLIDVLNKPFHLIVLYYYLFIY